MKYKVYIPSRKRSDQCYTVKLCEEFDIDYKIFVEDCDYIDYCNVFGKENIVNLGGSDYGNVTYARNFIKQYSIDNGEEKHWQLDDDIKHLYKFNFELSKNEIVDPREALEFSEGVIDSFDNARMLGLSANTFLKSRTGDYQVNTFTYGCVIIDNRVDHKWDNEVEDDLDYNLQILSSGDCTIRINKYNFYFMKANTKPGGFTDLREDVESKKERIMNTINKWKHEHPSMEMIYKHNNYRVTTSKIWNVYKKKNKLIKFS